MNIRLADKTDVDFLLQYDKHIQKEELMSVLLLKRILVVEEKGADWLAEMEFILG